MVTDLEDANGWRRRAAVKRQFELRAGVTGEQHFNPSESQTQDHGVVIPHTTPFPVRHGWMQDVDHGAINLNVMPGLESPPRRALRVSDAPKIAQEGMRRNRHTLPDFQW